MKQVEQITSKGVLVLDCDETLSNRELIDVIIHALAPALCAVPKKFGKASRYCFVNTPAGKPIPILAKNITYLGHPHPLYTKRIQIPKSFADFYHEHCHEYDVRFMGVYSYKGNTIFADFDAESYAMRKANNSFAHVWTNDLYQAVTLGSFHKSDAFGNDIEIMRADKLAAYLLGDTSKNPAFVFLDKFNEEYPSIEL